MFEINAGFKGRQPFENLYLQSLKCAALQTTERLPILLLTEQTNYIIIELMPINSFKLLLISLLILFTPHFLHPHSLQETIDLTLKNNISLASSQKQVEKARLEEDSTQKSWLPSLSLGSGYQHLSETGQLNMPTIGNINVGVNDNYENNINLSYVIFNGFGKESSCKLKKLQTNIQQLVFEQKQKETAFKVVSLYKKIESFLLQKNILNKGKERIDLQIAKVTSLIDNGLALPIERLTLSLSLSQYDQSLLQLESDYQSILDQLHNFADEPITVPLPPIAENIDKRPLTNSSLPSYTNSEIPKIKLTQNEPLKILNSQKESIKTNKNLISSRYYPSLIFQTGYHYSKPGLNPMGKEWLDYYNIGAKLNWKFWDWGAIGSQAQAQEKFQESLALQIEWLTEQIQSQYRKSVRDYQAILKQLSVQAKAVELATERIALLSKKTNEGIATATDFRSADTDLTQAKLKYFQLLTNIALKQIELDYLSGKPINKWRLGQ
ncbi:TolC family protein [Candidatus Margulisiibacteriota bacterium]